MISFLDSKVQYKLKLHAVIRGLPKLNGQFHYVNFINLSSPFSKIYFACLCTVKNIWDFLWQMFPFENAAQTTTTIILLSVRCFLLFESVKTKLIIYYINLHVS